MSQGRIWFMEGLSSQREIIQSVCSHGGENIVVYASHRQQRNEILSTADFSIREPSSDENRLDFIQRMISVHGINAVHVGRNCRWFEERRAVIESCGVSLTTGATSVATFDVADDKVAFAQKMELSGLPVVPSLLISSEQELREQLAAQPFDSPTLCIKPVRGIYGLGFWIFDDNVSSMASFNNPDNRRVRAQLYLSALAEMDTFEPMVLMPYLPGPEHSIDILAEHGKVIAAVARCKKGLIQELSNGGEEYELAIECTKVMGADGLINVQTRRDEKGSAVLLETNLRPSGGIGYTLNSGVNLPLLFAQLKLGLLDADQASQIARSAFKAVSVRSLTQAIIYDHQLINAIEEVAQYD